MTARPSTSTCACLLLPLTAAGRGGGAPKAARGWRCSAGCLAIGRSRHSAVGRRCAVGRGRAVGGGGGRGGCPKASKWVVAGDSAVKALLRRLHLRLLHAILRRLRLVPAGLRSRSRCRCRGRRPVKAAAKGGRCGSSGCWGSGRGVPKRIGGAHSWGRGRRSRRSRHIGKRVGKRVCWAWRGSGRCGRSGRIKAEVQTTEQVQRAWSRLGRRCRRLCRRLSRLCRRRAAGCLAVQQASRRGCSLNGLAGHCGAAHR